MKKSFKIWKMVAVYFVVVAAMVFTFMANNKVEAQLPPPASHIFLFSATQNYRKVTVTVSWKERGVDKSLEYTTLLYDLK